MHAQSVLSLYVKLAITALISVALYTPSSAEEGAGQENVEAIATKVEQKAEKTEKAEGSKDLVEDTVAVKHNSQGEPIIEQTGEASYYGKGFHGKETASGETFNQHELTAAHPTLPLGTEAKVTNLETGKTVEVEINDRGPYAKGRDIDLSKAAAQELGMVKDGDAPVKIEAEVTPDTDAQKKD